MLAHIGKVFDTDTEFTVELLIKACDESIVDNVHIILVCI